MDKNYYIKMREPIMGLDHVVVTGASSEEDTQRMFSDCFYAQFKSFVEKEKVPTDRVLCFVHRAVPSVKPSTYKWQLKWKQHHDNEDSGTTNQET